MLFLAPSSYAPATEMTFISWIQCNRFAQNYPDLFGQIPGHEYFMGVIMSLKT